jgi:diguanylate cyclase (GGDEF)-like protein
VHNRLRPRSRRIAALKKESNIGWLVALIIVIGISISSVIIYFAYNRVISDNSQSIAELSTMNIYSEINSELTKPIYVSLTMANDSFVKNWLSNESSASDQDIIEYLEGIQEKYDYSSVFLISSQTLHYYRHTGLHKTITPEDAHDVWYYQFVQKSVLYELDVDVDEANHTLTIFVNAKIYNANEDFLGVIGVGVEMNYIQTMISSFETEYELEAFLINDDGLVQSHSFTPYIETRNVFDESLYAPYRDQLASTTHELIVVNVGSSTITSRFIDELDWHIIVVKDSHVLLGFLRDYFATSFIAMCVITLIVLIIINRVVMAHKRKVYDLAIRDHLTLLYNRRGFDQEYRKIADLDDQTTIVFMIDIDNFKRFNDLYGHVYGDEILIRCAKLISEQIGHHGILSRWGGDEYAGILQGDFDQMIAVIEKMRDVVRDDADFSMRQLTISIGYTVVSKTESMDQIIKRVDKALYRSKEAGGNRITIE